MKIHIPKEIEHYEPELSMFFQGMIDKLFENRDKGKWEDVKLDKALELLNQEIDELLDGLAENSIEGILSECCDIANFALIIACLAIKGTKNPFANRVKVGKPLEFMNWALQQDVDYCLLWPYRSRGLDKHDGKSYGQLSKGKSPYGRRVSRIVCITAHGEPPTDRHQAAHGCGNSLCINKNHIRWATQEENNADKKSHGTNVTPVKMDWNKVKELRDMRNNGAPAILLSEKFNINVQSVYKIINNQAYKREYEK